MTVVLNPFPGGVATPLPPAIPPWEGPPSTGPNFADLLRGLVYPCSGAPGFLEEAGQEPAKPTVGADADIFNQDGLFQGAVAAAQGSPISSLAPVADTDLSESDGAIPLFPTVEVSASALQQLPTTDAAIQSPGAAADIISVISSEPPAAEIAAGAGIIAEAQPQPLARSAPATLPAQPQVTENPAELPQVEHASTFRARMVGLLPRLITQNGGAISTQVSVQAVEHGLRVVARLDGSSQEERGRIRERIAATLSRHGYISRTITLNGDTGTVSTGMEER